MRNIGGMTALKSYLDRTGEKQTAFAVRLKTTVSTVSRFCAGTLKPSLEMAHRIEAATGGDVPMSSWVDAAQEAAE